jgi:hypothetical protein
MRHAKAPSVVSGAMSARLLVLAVVVSLVAACGTASFAVDLRPDPSSHPGTDVDAE